MDNGKRTEKRKTTRKENEKLKNKKSFFKKGENEESRKETRGGK